MDLNFNIEDTILIEQNKLNILKSDYKAVYLFDELPAFKDIPTISSINTRVLNQQEKNLNDLKEKCPNYSDINCRRCLRVLNGHCLQRVIGYFTEANLHAHSPVEFGDISFNQRINGSIENIVGIVKSYQAAPQKTHKYTQSNDGGLLSQVLNSIFDSRIHFLAIITAADIEPRFQETIKSLVKWKQKKIVFFGRNELVRILSQYFN